MDTAAAGAGPASTSQSLSLHSSSSASAQRLAAEASSASLSSSLGLAWASYDGRLDAYATQPSPASLPETPRAPLDLPALPIDEYSHQPQRNASPPSYLFARPRRLELGASLASTRPLAGGRTLDEMAQAALQRRQAQAAGYQAELSAEASSSRATAAPGNVCNRQRRRFDAMPLSLASDDDVIETELGGYGETMEVGKATRDSQMDSSGEGELRRRSSSPAAASIASHTRPQGGPLSSSDPLPPAAASYVEVGLELEPSLASFRPPPRPSWHWRTTQELGLIVDVTDPSLGADDSLEDVPSAAATTDRRTGNAPTRPSLPCPSRLADVSSGEMTTPVVTQDVSSASNEEPRDEPRPPPARRLPAQLQMASQPVPPPPPAPAAAFPTSHSQHSQLSQPSSSTETDVSVSEMTESQRERVRRLRASATLRSESEASLRSPGHSSIYAARRAAGMGAKSHSMPTLKRPALDDGSETEEEGEDDVASVQPTQPRSATRAKALEGKKSAPRQPSRKTLGTTKRRKADDVAAAAVAGPSRQRLQLTTALPAAARRPVRFDVDKETPGGSSDAGETSTASASGATSGPTAGVQRRLRSLDRRNAPARQLFTGLVFRLVGNTSKWKRLAENIVKAGGVLLPDDVALSAQTDPAPTHIIGCPTSGNRPCPVEVANWGRELFGGQVEGDGRGRPELKGKEYLGILWVSDCLKDCLRSDELLHPATYRIFKHDE